MELLYLWHLLILLIASISLPIITNAENYKCSYEFQNIKKNYQLNRENNYFSWITNSGKTFKISILSESPKELVLGGKFGFAPDTNYYKIYYLDKNSLKINSENILSPKSFYSNYPVKNKKLHQCIIAK